MCSFSLIPRLAMLSLLRRSARLRPIVASRAHAAFSSQPEAGCCITFGGEPVAGIFPTETYHVEDERGELLGRITSVWYSPKLQTNVGFAFLPQEFTKLGTQLNVALSSKLESRMRAAVTAQVDSRTGAVNTATGVSR